MPICHRCNANNPGRLKYCANCGARLIHGQSATGQTAINTCPHCKASNPTGANFCISCGMQLGSAIIATEQPIYPQRVLGEPPKLPLSQHNWKAIVSMILGIIGILAWLLPFTGFPITVAGLVLGILGLKSLRSGMAIAGLILCCIFLIATIINSALGVLGVMETLQGLNY